MGKWDSIFHNATPIIGMKFIIKTSFCFSLFLVSTQEMQAQTGNDSLRLNIILYDAFSEDKIPGARGSVFAEDDTTMLTGSMDVSFPFIFS